MKGMISLLVIVGFICGSCQTKSDSRDSEITGIYVREYSYKVIHPNTGQEIGLRTIRDSIFIEAEGSQYRIINRKWRKNEYDDLGWQNMAHAEDRPIPEFIAAYDHADNSIESPTGNRLFYDPNESFIYWTKDFNYLRVEE
jgi:hypothetical protein